MVYIPKARKINHNTPKDYRPISLSSFLLKTMERLIDVYVRILLSPQTLVDTIESGLDKKEYILASFLDIESAFNNIMSSILEPLNELIKKVMSWTVNWKLEEGRDMRHSSGRCNFTTRERTR